MSLSCPKSKDFVLQWVFYDKKTDDFLGENRNFNFKQPTFF